MFKKKCINCNETIEYKKIFSNILFSVEQKPIVCEKCDSLLKPNISNAIVIVAALQVPIIPVIANSNLTIVETILGFSIYFPVVIALFLWSTTFSIIGNDVND